VELTRNQLMIRQKKAPEKKDGPEIHQAKGKKPWPSQFHSNTETRILMERSPGSVSRTLMRTEKKTKKIT
jgi:hypothetical protein